MKVPPTLKLIANNLDISISTVSRALSNHIDISNSTKEKVKKEALRLNYVPNLLAKAFRSQKTNIIGVIVPSITDFFTTTILRGILLESEKAGYTSIISETNNSPEKQKKALKTMLHLGVDGIIMSLSKNTVDITPILNILEKKPLILFDRVSSKIPCTQIIVDETAAAFKAIEHLISIGKKRIAIIKEPYESSNSDKKYQGYLQALKKNGIIIDESLILEIKGDLFVCEGRKLTKELISLKKKPDAIFCVNDDLAIRAVETLNDFNIKIPKEIAVVGFNNSFQTALVHPSVTTVDLPGNRIGRLAIQQIVKEIDSKKEYIISKSIEIKTSLVIRQSTVKV